MPYITGNFYLTLEEMKQNALYLWNGIQTLGVGWTLEAVSGMLGNMQSESTINPGIWENLDEGNLNGGYGLVQWTPASKYINWANENNYDITSMNTALLRFFYELDNNLQWIATSEYPLSFAEFLVSTATPAYLAQAFLRNYERPANPDQPQRSTQATFWYEYLGGEPPPPPRTKSKLPIIYYLRRY